MPSLWVMTSGRTGGPWVQPAPVAKLGVDMVTGLLHWAAATVGANLHGQEPAPEPLR
jgi:hypothetical protein